MTIKEFILTCTLGGVLLGIFIILSTYALYIGTVLASIHPLLGLFTATTAFVFSCGLVYVLGLWGIEILDNCL